MKKKIAYMVCILCCISFALTGCGNKDMWDTQYTFNYANIKLQTGEIVSGEIESWTDFEDADQIQLTIDGVVYLEHISNVDLIYDKSLE